MRIHIWPEQDGRRRIMVVPGGRAHLAPVFLGPTTQEKLRQDLRDTIVRIGLAENPPVSAEIPL